MRWVELHPDAEKDEDALRRNSKTTWWAMQARLQVLAQPGGRVLGELVAGKAVAGRLMSSGVQRFNASGEEQLAVLILYVERRDRDGIGVLHLCEDDEDFLDPAYEVAHQRLEDKPDW